MAKANNCSDKCSSYEYCEKEGNTTRFIEGATCTDFSLKEVKKKKTAKKKARADATDKEIKEVLSGGDSAITKDIESRGNSCVIPKSIPALEGMRDVVSGRNKITIHNDLYLRCSREIGLSDAQIASYPDAESLKRWANGNHPKSNPDARIKQGKVPEPPKFEQMMKDVFTLESVLEAKFIKSNREHFDRNSLNTFLCNIRRRYGPQEPVRIVTDQNNKVVKRELVTTFTIYYK